MRKGMELIDAIRDSIDTAMRIRDSLNGIARALDRVGMTTLADELGDIAGAVVEGPKSVQDAHTGYQTSQLRHSEAMMGNLLKATLDGCIGPASQKAKS